MVLITYLSLQRLLLLLRLLQLLLNVLFRFDDCIVLSFPISCCTTCLIYFFFEFDDHLLSSWIFIKLLFQLTLQLTKCFYHFLNLLLIYCFWILFGIDFKETCKLIWNMLPRWKLFLRLIYKKNMRLKEAFVIWLIVVLLHFIFF